MIKKSLSPIPHGGYWHIENNTAWFVGTEYNILFQIDMDVNHVEYLSELPNNKIGEYALNTTCLKVGKFIFCMPYTDSKSIWVYQMDTQQFNEILLNVSGQEDGALICDVWQYDDRVFALSMGLKKIIEIDIERKSIENYYSLGDTSDITIGRGAMVGNSIYIAAGSSNKIYQFDVKTKYITVHTIDNITDHLYTICFDGEKFWLSGYRRAVYVWDGRNNIVRVIDDFSKQFGLYCFEKNRVDIFDCSSDVCDSPIFDEVISIGEYIWYMSSRSNIMIYIHKNDLTVNYLKIEEEHEIKSKFYKYNVLYGKQYVAREHYIGIFSYSNHSIIEVDAIEKKVEKKIYVCNEKLLNRMIDLFNKYSNPYNEYRDFDSKLFEADLMKLEGVQTEKKSKNIGLKIHKEIVGG